MNNYQHFDTNQKTIDLPIGKVVCVGRNYVAHAKELNNPIPSEPILFIKPASSLIHFNQPIFVSKMAHEVHYELEVSVLINKTLTHASEDEVKVAIGGIGLSLDLTFRGLQDKLKKKGHPWEKAKAFDKSCPMSDFATETDNIDLSELKISLMINDEIKQVGNSSQMIFDIISLIEYISNHFTLQPGDVILTGTPSGVGVLNTGDRLQAELSGLFTVETIVN